jgi:hypothetical protein
MKLIQSDSGTVTIQFSRSELRALHNCFSPGEMEERLRRMEAVLDDTAELRDQRNDREDEEIVSVLIGAGFPEYAELSFPLRHFAADADRLSKLVPQAHRLAEELARLL